MTSQAAGAGTATTVYCGHCGAPNAAGVGFCGRCGTALAQTQLQASTSSVLICPRCGASNAASARFCGACAQALAAGAAVLPVQAAGAAPVAPVYRPSTQAQFATVAPSKSRSGRPWLLLAGGVVALMIAFGIAAQLLRPAPPQAVQCPPQCPPPPRVSPLPPPNLFTSRAFGFSVEYKASSKSSDPEPEAKDDKSIKWTLYRGSSKLPPSPVSVAGEPQQGRSPQQIVDALQRSAYPDAKLAYAIPGAEAGYNASSYGNIYDVVSTPGTGQTVHSRLIIVAAVRNNVVVEMVGVGPYLTPKQFSYGQPNPSLTPLSYFIDRILNTIRWSGDQPL